MIKAFALASALTLAAGCGGAHAGAAAAPQDTKLRELAAKLAPAMPCDPPREVTGYARAECGNGSAFIEAYPDMQTLGLRVLTAAETGGYRLVGDNWMAGASMTDDLEKMKTYLGGRVLHVEYRDPTD